MDYYQGLTEDSPIGELYGHNESVLVPILCCDQRFLVSFTPLHSSNYADTIRSIVCRDTGHALSQNANSMKFGHIEHFLQPAGQFSPAQLDPVTMVQIRYRIPDRIIDATLKYCTYTTADEFFFVAGGDGDERMRRLNLWYKRLSDRFIDRFHPKSSKFTRIHPADANGDWYGYRKN